jgi:GNAT superfamily N-acetyltransferase
MDIAELDIDDASQVEALFALELAVHAADCPDNPPPLREPFVTLLRQAHPEGRIERLVATVDGELAGAAFIALPDIDNRHLTFTEVHVDPAHRRRGVGRALLDRAARRARQEQRDTLIAQATSAVPGGPPRSDAGGGFLAAMGFSPALVNILRRVDLSAVDDATERRLRDECRPHAVEYECLTWTGLTPDPLASGVAQLVNLINRLLARSCG